MDSQDLQKARKAFRDKDYVKALALLTPALDADPASEPLSLIAESLLQLGMPHEAAVAFERAGQAAQGGESVRLQTAAATAYLKAGRGEQALVIALRLFQPETRHPDLAFVIASSLSASDRLDIVEDAKSVLVESDTLEHLQLAARLIAKDRRNEKNLPLIKKLRKLQPSDQNIRFRLIDLALEYADFDTLAREDQRLRKDIQAGNTGILHYEAPHTNLMWCGDERLNGIADNAEGTAPLARNHATLRRARPHRWGDKIRVGYLSNDFWDQHATMRLLQHVIERHDRDRFEITLFCYTHAGSLERDQGGRARWREIVRIEDLSDKAAVDLIRARGIDILVDLKGLTGGSRVPIVNGMAAPVQVAWLGYPGTGTHIDYDYIIGDRIVLPESSKPFYHEKFCRMPDSYQPNDPVHRPTPSVATRAEHGLPEDAFVFGSFNASRKISLKTIKLWTEMLKRVKDSVLWILCDNATTEGNILRKLTSDGVRADKIVFARRLAYHEHIGRIMLADLALDTFPCNGHTTTSDMLWAGVPVLTVRGTNFASRVSESLLTAIGLPELVTADTRDYCELGIALAKDRERLAAIRSKLAANRLTTPLFDSERFCRHLEIAYAEMARRAKAGLPPDHFDVAALA